MLLYHVVKLENEIKISIYYWVVVLENYCPSFQKRNGRDGLKSCCLLDFTFINCFDCMSAGLTEVLNI